jgi:glycerophosphoryl diester phosphodiesterase
MLRYTALLIFMSSFFNETFAQQSAAEIKNKFPVKVIAHRGASGHAPENTISAVKKAIELGANYVEIDVHQTKDKEVVVIHDATLDRTTNHIGQVNLYRLIDIEMFDAGAKYSMDFKGEKIPTLEQVINETKGKAILLIEIKKGTVYYNGIEKNILKIIEKTKAHDWVEVQTFYDPVVKNWLALDTNIPVHKLMVGNVFPFYIDYMLNAGSAIRKNRGAFGINPNLNWLGKKLLSKIREHEKSCYVWTVNDPKDIQKAINLKVDGIITNYPERVIRQIAK